MHAVCLFEFTKKTKWTSRTSKQRQWHQQQRRRGRSQSRAWTFCTTPLSTPLAGAQYCRACGLRLLLLRLLTSVTGSLGWLESQAPCAPPPATFACARRGLPALPGPPVGLRRAHSVRTLARSHTNTNTHDSATRTHPEKDLDVIGFQVGHKLAERYAKDKYVPLSHSIFHRGTRKESCASSTPVCVCTKPEAMKSAK